MNDTQTQQLDVRALLAREPMHPRQKFAIAMAVALNALDGFDVLSISFAAPNIARQWNVQSASLGVVLSMDLLGMAVGAFVLGALADRVGRRPVILASLFVMAAGMAVAAYSDNVFALSMTRLFTGIGIGGMLAATNAIVAESANFKRRNLCIALMAGGYPLGAVLGGWVASALLASTGAWQSIFIFGAIITAAFIPMVFLLVPETIAFLCHRQPQGAIEQVNRILKSQRRAPIAHLPRREEEPRRAKPGQVFQGGRAALTILLTVSYSAHIMTFYFFVKWVPKIVAGMGYAPPVAGRVLVWANAGGALGSVAISLLTQRVGVRPLVIAAMLCGAVGVTAFGQGASTLASLSVITAICGFFINGATAGLYAVFAQSFPVWLRASGTGIVIGVGRGGAALGPVLGGILFSLGWPLNWVATAMAGGSFIGAVALGCIRYHEVESG
jgi:benzoate transport